MGCHFLLQCRKVKSESEVAQSCPTLSNPMDCSLPGSSIHGIFQARVLEWGAIAFFWDPYNSYVSVLNVVPEVSETVFIYFYFFSLFCSASVLSTILSSRSLIHFSASNSLLLVPSLTVAPRLHRHHSTEDKTSRLMVKTVLSC